jgi:hypothetical protein
LSSEARQLASAYTISIRLDGRAVRDPERFWVFYRNNGPLICRIYFPGDLGSLNMGANSLVLHPLPAGRHLLRVVVRHRVSDSQPVALRIAEYHLRVLPRLPNATERAIAPEEDEAPPPNNRTPLTFRSKAA